MSRTRRRLFVSASALLLAALGLPAAFATAIRGAEAPEEIAAAIAEQEQALDGIETLYAKATVLYRVPDGKRQARERWLMDELHGAKRERGRIPTH